MTHVGGHLLHNQRRGGADISLHNKTTRTRTNKHNLSSRFSSRELRLHVYQKYPTPDPRTATYNTYSTSLLIFFFFYLLTQAKFFVLDTNILLKLNP